ncbi:MAG: hypothetical protein WC140_02115 [Bacteroidales bacterium]
MDLRVAKKDVHFFTDEFIDDAFLSMSFLKDEKQVNKIVNLVNKVIDNHDDMIDQINHPIGDNMRKYYRTIMEKYLTDIDNMYTKLADIHHTKK